jgi:hypothetical protein
MKYGNKNKKDIKGGNQLSFTVSDVFYTILHSEMNADNY